jgi:hypothetical protein
VKCRKVIPELQNIRCRTLGGDNLSPAEQNLYRGERETRNLPALHEDSFDYLEKGMEDGFCGNQPIAQNDPQGLKIEVHSIAYLNNLSIQLQQMR